MEELGDRKYRNCPIPHHFGATANMVKRKRKRGQFPVPSLFACLVQVNRPQRASRKLEVLP